jgi:uncharacterized protein (TIGR02271 family)
MITREEISILLDHPVYDGDGNKIGDAKHVFLDDASGRPEWVTVKTGLFGSNESFIPIRDAALVQDHLEVPYRKDKVKGAPNVDIDAGGHLSMDEEHRLYDYYGIDWDTVLTEPGERERDRGPGMGTAGTAGAAGAAGAAGMTGRREESTRAAGAPGTAGKAGMAGRPGTAGTGGAAGTAGAAGKAGAAETAETAGTTGRRGEARSGARGDDAMTRSEEQMHVGVERHETGRARLRKYVVTEEVQQTVPLRHEEVRVEREPITDANRGDAMSGPDLSEDEYEVTLHEERAVVETEAVPVERVRLTTEEKTTDETVRGQVRKERIEAETETETEDDARPRGRDASGPQTGS